MSDADYYFVQHQVVSFHDRLTKLEQEKEHWMLESQLLQMKYEKEIQVRNNYKKNHFNYFGGGQLTKKDSETWSKGCPCGKYYFHVFLGRRY